METIEREVVEVTESLEVQAARRMIADAEILGVGDHPATEKVREMLDHSAGNGGAMMWWRLNKGLPEAEWPIGCCTGNDMNSPEYCLCWVPVFDLDQADPQLAGSWKDCEPQDGMCHDCAYRPNSPERNGNSYDEEVLLDLATSSQQVFFCHAGMRRPKLWRHPDGREVPGDVKDYQPPFVDSIPYRADGRPGLVCGGWSVLREKWKKDVAMHPSWLQDLVDMHAAGEILPGGMVWVDEPPADGRNHANFHQNRKPFKVGAVESPDDQAWSDVMITPMPTRIDIMKCLRRHPGRWARVYDGGRQGARVLARWYVAHLPGSVIDAVTRRQGPAVAVYARYMAPGVL